MVVRNGHHFTLPQEQRGQQRLTSLLCLSLSAGRCLANKTPVREIYLEDSTWRGAADQLASRVVSSVFSDEALKWPNHILKYVQNQPWYSFNSASLLLCCRRGVAPKTFGVFCWNSCVNLFSCVSRHGRCEEFCSEHFTSFRIFVLFIRYVVCDGLFSFIPSFLPPFCLCSILAFSPSFEPNA